MKFSVPCGSPEVISGLYESGNADAPIAGAIPVTLPISANPIGIKKQESKIAKKYSCS